MGSGDLARINPKLAFEHTIVGLCPIDGADGGGKVLRAALEVFVKGDRASILTARNLKCLVCREEGIALQSRFKDYGLDDQMGFFVQGLYSHCLPPSILGKKLSRLVV